MLYFFNELTCLKEGPRFNLENSQSLMSRLINPRSTLFMDGPMKEIIVVKIKAVHASRAARLCGARGLCATYDIKRIAFAKTAEEWPSRPCSRTFMAFRDSVPCTVGLAGWALHELR